MKNAHVKICRHANINKYFDFQCEALNKIDKRQQTNCHINMCY